MAVVRLVEKGWRGARAAWALAILTALVWLLSVGLQWSSALVEQAGFIPARMLGDVPGQAYLVPAWLTPVSALFVQAGFYHLLLNLIAILLFGRSIEPAVGSVGLVLLYLAGALAAAAVYYLVHPSGLPLIGATGGAGALLGAYAILFGRTRVTAGTRAAAWSYAAWLCVGWTLLSLLLFYPFANLLAVYYAPAVIAAFLAGFALGRLPMLIRYRKA